MPDVAPESWTIEVPNPLRLRHGLDGISNEQFAELLQHFRLDINTHGTAIFALGSAKWLCGGLAEYRFRKNPDLLLRMFFFVRGNHVVVLLTAYNKKRDPSRKRQQREIAQARTLMWKNN